MKSARYHWETFKAWRRGEKRINKHAERGRCFVDRKTGEHRTGAASPEGAVMGLKPTATMTMVVTRADGTVEEFTRPATIERQDG